PEPEDEQRSPGDRRDRSQRLQRGVEQPREPGPDPGGRAEQRGDESPEEEPEHHAPGGRQDMPQQFAFRRQLQDRRPDLGGGRYQPRGDQAECRPALPEEGGDGGHDQSDEGQGPALGPGSDAPDLKSRQRRIRSSGSRCHDVAVQEGSRRSSTPASTSTSDSITPDSCRTSPAPRIVSRWGSLMVESDRSVLSSCTAATSRLSPAASARIWASSSGWSRAH